VNKWRLLIDSSKRNLKVVLLHNGNNYASLSIGHSVHLKENYENLELVHNSGLDDLWRSEGVLHTSTPAGWLYQVPMFRV
jgi:hypothetical protein